MYIYLRQEDISKSIDIVASKLLGWPFRLRTVNSGNKHAYRSRRKTPEKNPSSPGPHTLTSPGPNDDNR